MIKFYFKSHDQSEWLKTYFVQHWFNRIVVIEDLCEKYQKKIIIIINFLCNKM